MGVVEKPKLVELPMASGDPTDALIGKRRIYLGPEDGEVEASVYNGDILKPGNIIEPPGIIQEMTTTLAVLPGSKVRVTRYGNYFIELE